MARVLLKRQFRTPYGRFDRSVDEEPTSIPDTIIARLKKAEEKRDVGKTKVHTGLPSDAVIVGDDYVSPAEVAEETGGLGEANIAMTAAEQEDEINQRVNKILDEREAKAKAEAEGPRGPLGDNAEEFEDDLLDNSVADIVEQLPDFSVEELQDLLERESAGKARSTLVVEIEAAIEDTNE